MRKIPNTEEVELYNILLENSLDVITKVDIEGELLYVSPACEQLLGFKPEELMNQPYFNLIYATDLEMAQRRQHNSFTGEKNSFETYRLQHKNGTYIWVEATCKPIIDQHSKKVTGFVIVIRDISERKKTESLLLQSEKLTVAGQLAAGIAHEIRNPLTAIKGFLQLMDITIEEEKTYFEIITSEIDRIELILSELLTLAKPQDMKFEMKELHILIEHVKTLIDTQAIMKNIQILTHYESGNLLIKCDENQLKQVFINILKNSVEAMNNGGLITIRVVKHSTDKVKIVFIDEGDGIPEHIMKRIGEPFFTTKDNGTGLGLMISKQIIQNHNGDLHLMSDTKGTTLEVILDIK